MRPDRLRVAPELPAIDAKVVRRLTELVGLDLPVEELCIATCAALAELANAPSCTLAILESGLLRIVAAHENDIASVIELTPEAEQAASTGTTVRGDYSGYQLLCVPLRIGARTIGVVIVRRPAATGFSEEDVAFLEICSLYVAAGIRGALDAASREKLVTLSTTDALTGVGNRRRFEEVLANEWQRALRRQAQVAILMLDVDHFKAFNDRYGHLAGDACLQQVARTCADQTTRAGDLFARYGGEEFVAVLADTDLAGAITVAETMRKAILALTIPHEGSRLGQVSVSIGAAMLVPEGTLQPSALIEAGDAALYAAKDGGRNRVGAKGYLSESEPALRVRDIPPPALPVQLSAFYGREREQAEVAKLLEVARLVTLAGPGGVGKTRLSIEVARPRSTDEPVWFVNLAAVSDSAAVASTIFDAMRFKERGTPAEAAATILGNDSGLLILDNCEHVVATCAEIAEAMLHAAPGLRILATSREPLAIAGELTYRIPPLALPPEGTTPDAATALEFDAIRLFVERAKLARPDFALDESNVAVVVRICRKLDGIALAIELATPRLKLLGLPKLEDALEDRLRLLTGGSRTALPRQQTLEALIGWSYDLLSDVERRVFRNLSVLVGTWTREAAAAVDGGLDVLGMLDVLGTLTEKSLLVPEPNGVETSYRFLETTRAYAQAKLNGQSGFDAASRRAAVYFLDLIRNAVDGPSDHFHRTLVEAGDAGQAALIWTLRDGGDPEIGFALVDTMCHADATAAERTADDMPRWCEMVLAHPAATNPGLRRRLGLALAFRLLIRAGELKRAREIATPLLAEAEAAGDERCTLLALRILGGCAFYSADMSTARAMAERAIHLDRFPNVDMRAAMYTNYAATLVHLGDLNSGIDYHMRALALPGVSGPQRDFCMSNYVWALRVGGDFETVERLLGSGEYHERLSRWSGATYSISLAHCLVARGEIDGARRNLRLALGIISADKPHRHEEQEAFEAIEYFAAVAIAYGEFETAARFIGHASHRIFHRPLGSSAYGMWYAGLKNRVREQLGDDAYAQLTAAGEKMPFKDAVSLAFSL